MVPVVEATNIRTYTRKTNTKPVDLVPSIDVRRNVTNKQLSKVKDICGYFPCAPFPRLETDKVVWVLSFDLSRIRINKAFRYSYSCHIRVPTFY